MKNNKNIKKLHQKSKNNTKTTKIPKTNQKSSKISKNRKLPCDYEKNYRRECGLGLYKNLWKHSANQFGNIGIEYKSMAAIGR